MWRRPALAGLLVLAAVAAIGPVALSQTPSKTETKPTAPKPRSGRPLPPLLAQRASIKDVVKQNGGSADSEAAVAAGLDWLLRHQEPDGSWSCHKFRARCATEGYKCGGNGQELYDVGVTALALLAFLGAGNSENEGRYKDTVRNGVKWLKSQQNAQGCYPTTEDYRYPYMHAMATLAMVEDAVLSGATPARDSAQRGLDFIGKIQSPQTHAWRYAEKPPDADSTVTAWMVLALKTGQVANIRSNDAGLRGATEFVKKITDEKTFRTGYVKKGDAPFRLESQLRRFPPGESESLSACGMTVRVFCGEEPRGSGALRGQAHLFLDKPPEWNPDSGRIDLFYWHFASLGMFQLGGEEWKTWMSKLKEAALSGQQKGNENESCQRGSWDPIDPWGTQGGRIYSTAMMILCLETPYRYGRLYDQ
jgi:hypothetical protein